MFARCDVPVTLKRIYLAVIGDADMPAFDHDRASLASDMGKFSVPTALPCDVRFDLLNGDGMTSPEQLMAAPPNGLFGCIPVQDLCAATPIGNAAAYLPRKNRIVRLIEKVGLAPQQLLGMFALRDIAYDADGSDWRPCVTRFYPA